MKLVRDETNDLNFRQITARTAHDLNNCVTAIRGFAQLFDPELYSQKEKVCVDRIEKAAVRAGAMTRRLINLSFDIAEQVSVVDLHIILPDIFEMMRPQMKGSCNLCCDFKAQDSFLSAPHAILQPIFENIIVNGFAAMEAGGTMIIKTHNFKKDDTNWIGVVVSDDGCGMSQNVLDRILEHRYTTNSDSGGMGLGLASVDANVKELGGTVHIASNENVGTSVSVSLPLVKA